MKTRQNQAGPLDRTCEKSSTWILKLQFQTGNSVSPQKRLYDISQVAAGERAWYLSGNVNLTVGGVLAEVGAVKRYLAIQAVQYHDSQTPQVN